MWREYRIIEALWPTDVPVPQPVAYCDDRAVAETHFYVMGRSSGKALHSATSVAGWLDVSARRRAADEFVEVLAALHCIEPDAVGLGDLGRPTGYAARQIRTWHSSWVSQVENAGYDDSRADELHAVLSARMPADGAARVVHGDFGPHNALFRRTGEISAVLDWEIATLGDPLADLAYVVNAWVGPNDELVDVHDPLTRLPGFPSRDRVIDRYVELTGSDVSSLPYYRVFSFWRRACILQGVYARYRTGQKKSNGFDLDGFRARISALLGAAVELVEKIP
jgi:aminoglycoside phosphotransferase (APT) family kinase protein